MKKSNELGFDDVPPRAARALDRRRFVNPVEIFLISKMTSEDRATYFYHEVLAHQEVWTAWDDHGILGFGVEKSTCVPFWPHEVYVTQVYPDAKTTPIPIDDWIDVILEQMRAVPNAEVASLFPTKSSHGSLVRVVDLYDRLIKEMTDPSDSVVTAVLTQDMKAKPRGKLPE